MKRHAPATERNRDPILAVLERVLPPSGLVLEVASGSGEHVVYFAAKLPRLTWQPTDVDRSGIAGIEEWITESGLGNVRPPLVLDAEAASWPVERADAVLCTNMIHIAPFAACVGLMRGAAAVLASGAVLVTYGPYKVDGQHTAPSNESFDAGLRARNPEWGVRDVGDVVSAAAEYGLALVERIPMPANNFMLVFRMTSPAALSG